MLWPLNASAATSRARILVDGSGSMRGYFPPGRLVEVVALIGDLVTSHGFSPRADAFVSQEGSAIEWTPWADWLASKARDKWGTETKLDKALVEAQDSADLIILVTDNFRDAAADAGGAQLYRTMRSLGLPQVYLIPALLPFDGNVDLYPGDGIPRGPDASRAQHLRKRLLEHTDETFRTRGLVGTPRWLTAGARGHWKVPYRGRRGLAIYVLATAALKETDVASQVASMIGKRAADSVAPLHVRPLGQGAVTLLPASGRHPPDPKDLACGGDKSLPQPNLKLVPEEGGPGRYRLLQRGVDGSTTHFDPRTPSALRFAAELRSGAGHVEIAQSGEDCEGAARIELADFELNVEGGDKGILTLPESPSGQVTPAHLSGSLRADARGTRSIFVTINVPQLVGKEVGARHFGGQLVLRANIVIRVPRRSLHLARSVANRYFSQTPSDLARIYSPVDVVQSLAMDGDVELRIPLELRPTVEALPPPPPTSCLSTGALWGLGTGLALLALLWGVFRPLGLTVPIFVAVRKKAVAVRVGGLLRPRVSELNVGGDQAVRVSRPSPWRRAVLIRTMSGDAIGLLEPGARVHLGDGSELRHLTRARATELQREGRYDSDDFT